MTPIQISEVDIFPLDPDQWSDDDADWVGDQQFSPNSDGCLGAPGRSIWDRLGCPDTDGDGYSNPDQNSSASPDGEADAFNEASQWMIKTVMATVTMQQVSRRSMRSSRNQPLGCSLQHH